MSLGNRPFIGTWQLNNRTLVRHVPDVVVLINGYSEFASCATCDKKIDIHQYITQVSADATTDPIATANISFKIPRHATDVWDRDGNFLLHPGLEVIILFRGYFPTKDYAGRGQDPEGGFDADNVSVYPYYQVFRGVVTECSHEYSGGFYSGSMSCANMLHMWQNLKVSVNGAAYGKRPTGSAVQPHLIGHKFTGANPYAVVYTLSKVGFGAAFGVEFQYSQASNIAAIDDSGRNSLYKHAAEWWEKRWSESTGRLRMFGINGKMFNDFEQAYLGRWYDTASSSRGVLDKTLKTVRGMFKAANGDKNPFLGYKDIKRALREVGYDRYAVAAGAYSTSKGKKASTEDVVRMQAFSLDIGKMGSVNMFETEYLSKLDIVNTVCEITGFEFYQDVDGDLVFKPPMYNMDTREDPVYVIKDRDLISIDESESEPEYTMMKGTGSHFANLQGHGVDGWAGVGAVYIDYKLVSQFGYKEQSFECNYFSSKQALYMSAINRLDIANVGMRSGSISIPLRPELRPGYPVYVESEDCFYYIKSLSHSFSFGGEATTSISWVGKRRKWLPPMDTDGNSVPSIENVRLDAPGEYPPQPLFVYPEDTNSAEPPRMAGFPNVVLALDPDKLNYDTVDMDRGTLTSKGFIQMALSYGFLERTEEEGVFLLRKSNTTGEKISVDTITTEWNSVALAVSQGEVDIKPTTNVGYILYLMQQSTGTLSGDMKDSSNLINFLALQSSLRSQFAPGTDIQGRYRYYSCSHPKPEHQAPRNSYINQEDSSIEPEDPENSSSGATIKQFKNREGQLGVTLVDVPANTVKGVRIRTLSAKSGTEDTRVDDFVPTSEIPFVVFGPQKSRTRVRVSRISATASATSNFHIGLSGFKKALADKISSGLQGTDQSEKYFDRLTTVEQDIYLAFLNYGDFVSSSPTSAMTRAQTKLEDYVNGNKLIQQTMEESKKKDSRNISKIVANLSTLYKNWLLAIQGKGGEDLKVKTKDLEKGSEAYNNIYQEYMVARQDFLNSIFGKETVKDISPGDSYVYTNKFTTSSTYTPIFPVSDANGFEVIGSLPYGRGVTIRTYSSLLQSYNEATEDGTPESKIDSSETTIGGSSLNPQTMEVVNQFLLTYLGAQGNTSAALNAFDEEKQNAILAWYSVANADQLGALLEVITDSEESAKVKIRNNPVTSYARGQSVFGDTAALNLANITPGEGVCVCKGADGAYLLAAMNAQNTLKFGQDAAFNTVREITHTKGQSWNLTREAYAGAFVEPRAETLREDLESVLSGENPFGPMGSQISNEATAIEQIVEEEFTGEGEEDG